jgi:hypothetical protein
MKIDFVNKIIEDEEILYHYTSSKIAIDYILKDLTLLASPLKGVNDPKENKEKYFSNTSEINLKDINSIMNEWFLNYSKIICFSQDNMNGDTHYDAGYGKSRMWSQYGENHKGICLGFKKRKILESFERVEGCFWKGNRNIEYTNNLHLKLPIFNLSLNPNIINDKISKANNISLYFGKNRNHFYFEKVNDWKQENEYRLVLFNVSKNKLYLDISEALHSIYLGVDFPKTEIKNLKKLIPNDSIQIYKIELINNLFYPKDITNRK